MIDGLQQEEMAAGRACGAEARTPTVDSRLLDGAEAEPRGRRAGGLARDVAKPRPVQLRPLALSGVAGFDQTLSMAKISRAATLMGNWVSVSLPATAANS